MQSTSFIGYSTAIQLGNSHDIVSCMLYWIHLVVCERSILCCIVYCVFRIPNVFFFLAFKQFDRPKPTLLLKNIWKHIHVFFIHTFWQHETNTTFKNIRKKMWIIVSNFYMKIINKKHTLLYNLPIMHSIQRYNGLCELTKWFAYLTFLKKAFRMYCLLRL